MFNASHLPRLLLVEDHQASRETMVTLLEQHGFTVSAAASAAEARQLSLTRSFDVALCDIGLPDEDGYSVMTYLRRRHPGIKGIAVTAYDSDEDRQKSKDSGFSAHLVKPVTFTRLKNVLWSVLGGGPTPTFNSPRAH